VPDPIDDIRCEIDASIAVKKEIGYAEIQSIAQASQIIIERLRTGAKLIAVGNGGSAADAQHIVAELVGRYRVDRKPIAAIALTTNSSSLTSIANDYGFDEVFARQLEAVAKPEDVVLAISTSGNSRNILLALQAAKRVGAFTIGLTGKTGGEMRSLVDLALTVPSESTPRIQEVHVLMIHILSGLIETALTGQGGGRQPSPAAVTLVKGS
jgi:D-sedoheptulose 7-phosphate isomerase